MRHKVKLNSVAMEVSTIRKVIRHQMAVVSGILSEYVDRLPHVQVSEMRRLH